MVLGPLSSSSSSSVPLVEVADSPTRHSAQQPKSSPRARRDRAFVISRDNDDDNEDDNTIESSNNNRTRRMRGSWLSTSRGRLFTSRTTKTTTTTQSTSNNKKKKINDNNSRRTLMMHWMGHVLRCSLLEMPVWICFAALCGSVLMEHFRDEYWTPQLRLETWNPERWRQEYTYYNRQCTREDQTAFSLDNPDLVYQPDDTPSEARRKMLTHGVTLYPNLLKPETANEVRDFIVKQNRVDQNMIHVIENEFRFSFAIQVDQDPSIPKALKELLANEHLVQALEEIIGPDPAIIEFTGITSAYGAKPQAMHADVVPQGSAQRFARNFVPSYSLFVPLQNTTSEMGATFVCPGTHICYEGANEFCDDTALQASGASNNWPAGWGVLLNQQTLHKGAAHVDPFGPDRVLFILTFAPRPRWNGHEVETRMLGTGGSYSLHWSNFGHHLRDWMDPTKHMAFPWRHLRAMGLYKPGNRLWGWDFWTVTFQRVAQGELGYLNYHFFEGLDNGIFDWIPEMIRGSKDVYGSVEDYGEDDKSAWVVFAETVVQNISTTTKTAYHIALSMFGVFLFTKMLFYIFGYRSSLLRPARRVVVGHIVIALVVWFWKRSMEHGNWARNIRRGLAFNTRLLDHSYLPDIPSTVVTKYDVLLADEYQSEYMGSLAGILDHSHVGNILWMQEVESSFVNYNDMPVSIRRELCKELVARSGQNHGRFLTKNQKNEWGAMTAPMAIKFCDKTLQTKGNAAVGFVVRWIEYLVSESRFGYWREEQDLKLHTIYLLQDLKARILQQEKVIVTDSSPSVLPSTSLKPKLSAISHVRHVHKQDRVQRPKRSGLPPRKPIFEPYAGAWLKVGDVVEGRYHGMFDEWYQGKIISVNEDSTWNVEYNDGDVDHYLGPESVRPFKGFQVGEKVAWKDPSIRDYVSGEILRHHPWDNTFDLKVLHDGHIILGVSPLELRRGSVTVSTGEQRDWMAGDRVMAFFEDDDEEGVFPALVTRVIQGKHSSKLYEIRFDDGFVTVVDELDIQGSAEDEELQEDWDVGDRVMAAFPGSEDAFPGVVSRKLDNDSYEIQYDDGDVAVVSHEMILGAL